MNIKQLNSSTITISKEEIQQIMELINKEVPMVDIIFVIVIVMNVIIVHEMRIVVVARVSKDVIVVVVNLLSIALI